MSWWAAHVSNNKEYDSKREIVSLKILPEESILIPRIMVYNVVNDNLNKKTEMLLPGYLLLNISNNEQINQIQSIGNHITIIGLVTDEEMEIVRSYENIPKVSDVHSGDKVIVTKGPLAGVKGITIEEIDENYYKCRLLFQGNEIIAKMDIRILEKII